MQIQNRVQLPILLAIIASMESKHQSQNYRFNTKYPEKPMIFVPETYVAGSSIYLFNTGNIGDFNEESLNRFCISYSEESLKSVWVNEEDGYWESYLND